LFFNELKRIYQKETGWFKRHFSIWRYHHCNFDRVFGLTLKLRMKD
jgi:hypothetical protein